MSDDAKKKAVEREKRYQQSMRDKGHVSTRVWVPEHRKAELLELMQKWRDEHEGGG